MIVSFKFFIKKSKCKQYSRFTDQRPPIAERVIRTVRSLLKKPVFEKRKANWLSALQSVIKQYNNPVHHSNKLTPIEASKKANEKQVYSNLQDRRIRQKPKYKLGQLVRTIDIREVFSKGDSAN